MEMLNQFLKLFVLDIRNTLGILFWGNLIFAILVFTFRYALFNNHSKKHLLVFGLSKIFMAIAWLAFFMRIDTTSFNPINFIIPNTLVFAGYYLESVAMFMMIKNSSKKAFRMQLLLFIAALLSFYIAVWFLPGLIDCLFLIIVRTIL